MSKAKRSLVLRRSRATIAAKRKASSRKLAVSFDERLATEVQRAARKETAGNVSAWLAAAARDRLRLAEGRRLLAEYEAEHGPVTDEQIAQIEREWPRG